MKAEELVKIRIKKVNEKQVNITARKQEKNGIEKRKEVRIKIIMTAIQL